MFTFLTLLALFLGTSIIGLIPIHLSISPKIINYLSVFGTGLLLGIALILLIPEGIDRAIDEVTACLDDKDGCPDAPFHVPFSGVALLFGFLFMIFFERLKPQKLNWYLHPVTFALCIHSIVDGLMIGFSMAASASSIHLTVLISMIVHKIPAVISLTLVLLKAGLGKKQIQLQVIIFSSIAPIFAFLSFLLLAYVEISSHLMFFSAGTFLFVAASQVNQNKTEVEDGKECFQLLSSEESSKVVEMGLLTLGSLTSLLLNIFHTH